jgi:PAS domain S-box-containing protein
MKAGAPKSGSTVPAWMKLLVVLLAWGNLEVAQAQPSPQKPARVIKNYALTASQDQRFDPSAWWLLGLNGGGEPRSLLDTQPNQAFDRSERKAFPTQNEKPYSIYRLQVDKSSQPGPQTRQAGLGIKAAELGLIGPAARVSNEAELQTVITAWVVAGLAAVLFLTLGWAVSQRKQVARRTKELWDEIAERKRAETFLNSILLNLPISVFLKEAKDLRFVMWNKHNEELIGYSSAQVLGTNDHDHFPKEQADQFVAMDREALRGKKLVETEEEIQTRAKGRRLLRTRKAPILDESGEPAYLLGISEDITERKQAEVELAYERELLRTLMDNSPDTIYFKDRESRFVKCTSSLAERFGVSREEMVLKSDFDFFDDAHARAAFEDEQEIIRTGRPVEGKIEHETQKNGRESWALTTKMPLRSKSGEIIGTFGISKDITAMKGAEAELDRLHKQLLIISRQAGMAEVATNVLHNVGNVLNSVNVSASMVGDLVRKSRLTNLAKVSSLLREHAADLGKFLSSDPKGRQLPGYIEQLAERHGHEQELILGELRSLTKNIDHIREIVSMQQNYAKVSGVIEVVAVADLVEDAIRMDTASLSRHNVQLIREFEEVAPMSVDKHKVLQILVNLLRNAKHACDEASYPEKHVTVRIERNGGSAVRISVRDNGVGIPPENLSVIFAHGFTTRKDGHGFGLHSGALAAREMGGTLTAQSAGAGCGAAFVLELPIQAKPVILPRPEEERPRLAV